MQTFNGDSNENQLTGRGTGKPMPICDCKTCGGPDLTDTFEWGHDPRGGVRWVHTNTLPLSSTVKRCNWSRVGVDLPPRLPANWASLVISCTSGRRNCGPAALGRSPVPARGKSGSPRLCG